MASNTYNFREISGTHVSDIYFLLDSARKSPISNISQGEFIFDLKQRGIIIQNDRTGLLLNKDALVNVIEIEISEIDFPVLADYVVPDDNRTDRFTVPDVTFPPLIQDTAPAPVGSMSQINNNIISMEIKENFPQISTTVDGANVTFAFTAVVDGTRLILTPKFNKYIFTTPKLYENIVSLRFRGPLAPLVFQPDVLYDSLVQFHFFDPPQRVTEYANDLVGAAALVGEFVSGVYDSPGNRIYLVPIPGLKLFINTITDQFFTYGVANTDVVNAAAYERGAYVNRNIYWAPFGEAAESTWHYTDTSSNLLKTYTNNSGFTPATGAYSGAFATPDGSRVYFIPSIPEASLLYVETINNNVVAYANNAQSEMVNVCYTHGVMTSTGLLYLIPGLQQSEPKWHYINTNTNTVMSYSNTTGLAPNALPYFRGGVLNLDESRIYLVPSIQAGEDTWYYIDINKNSIISYSNTSTPPPAATETSYNNGILTPDGRIYLIPSAQANNANWHYIDTLTDTVVAYTNDATTTPVSNAYFGGVATTDGRIYMIPNAQTDQAVLHKIDLGTGTIKFRSVNHGLVTNDRIFIETFNSTNSLINNYINRGSGLIVGANSTADEIFLNPYIDFTHNTVRILEFAIFGTYSRSVNIIVEKNRFFAKIRFRTLAENTTNRITPV